MSTAPPDGSAGDLVVAVTGPTGDIGRPFIRELERRTEVAEIRAMARRPFDGAEHGWRKATYRRGDVLDDAALAELVEGADVVVHLAFIIMGGGEEARRINLEGSRSVFDAAVTAGARRLVYTSSVAAYGFHPDSPTPLTEEVPPRGTEHHPYSHAKAELETVLEGCVADHPTDAYVFRPCIVAGPDSPSLIEELPYVRIAGRLPAPLRRLYAGVPILHPVLPDTGIAFQLVHADDVARALTAATLGHGHPGSYNLAAPDTITIADLATELGWYSLPIPELAVDAGAEIVNRLPLKPAEASWIDALRVPMTMDCSKAARELGWEPDHSSRETLRETVAAARGTLLPSA